MPRKEMVTDEEEIPKQVKTVELFPLRTRNAPDLGRILHAEMGVNLHDVPEDRVLPQLDQGLGHLPGLLREAGPAAPAEDYHPAALRPPGHGTCGWDSGI